MNLSTVALILLACQLLGSGNKQPPAPQPMSVRDILSDDVRNMLDSAEKLSDTHCNGETRASAIFEIIANPALQRFAGNIFGNMGWQNSAPPPEKQRESDGYGQEQQPRQEQRESPAPSSERANDTTTGTAPNVNSEGYRFDTPSPASREFFRPIERIADAEVKAKLYKFYENWYIK